MFPRHICLISAFLALSPLMQESHIYSSEVKAYFGPSTSLEHQLIDLILNEKEIIQACIYSFTHRGIAEALIQAHQKGVTVEVVVNRSPTSPRSPIYQLIEASIPVYVWDPVSLGKGKGRRSLMHHNFCVFGKDKVWTGSFNFSTSRKNREDAVIIEDSNLCTSYSNEFESIKIKGSIPFESYHKPPTVKKKVKSKGR